MWDLLNKLLWFFWKINYNIAKKLRFGSTLEELTIISVFGFSVFLSIIFASVLLFFQVEKHYHIDSKIISLLFFFLVSAVQLKFMFGKKQNFLNFSSLKVNFKEFFVYYLLWIIILILLGFAMIYDSFDGNLSSFLEYLKYMRNQ